MSTTRLTLLDIYHPAFRKGYQAGRQHYFRGQAILTDKELVACLQSVFEPHEQEKAEEREEGLFYAIGYLVGQMSGCVLPCQPHEDDTRKQQDAFLVKVMQKYGSAGQALVDTIGQFWTMQDQLAITLDADIFEQMLNRGAEESTL